MRIHMDTQQTKPCSGCGGPLTTGPNVHRDHRAAFDAGICHACVQGRGEALLAARFAELRAAAARALCGEGSDRDVIHMLLQAAVPNERDHPTMWRAWRAAEAHLARTVK